MVAIRYENVGLVDNHLVPYNNQVYRDNGYYYTAIVEPDIPVKGEVLQFMGSGATGHFTGKLHLYLAEKGYRVISTLPAELMYSKDPLWDWDNTYGDVTNPTHLRYTICDSWMVRNTIEQRLRTNSNLPYVFLGQSRGSLAVLSYLAGLSNTSSFDKGIKGCFLNAPAIGSRGRNYPNWRKTESVIRTVGNATQWSNSSGIVRNIHYGTNDTYVTPAMLDRIKSMVGDSSNPINFLTSDKGHSWMGSSEENSRYVADQIDNIFKGLPVVSPV